MFINQKMKFHHRSPLPLDPNLFFADFRGFFLYEHTVVFFLLLGGEKVVQGGSRFRQAQASDPYERNFGLPMSSFDIEGFFPFLSPPQRRASCETHGE